jgi:hypothetical protein
VQLRADSLPQPPTSRLPSTPYLDYYLSLELLDRKPNAASSTGLAAAAFVVPSLVPASSTNSSVDEPDDDETETTVDTDDDAAKKPAGTCGCVRRRLRRDSVHAQT